jgi:hypothetical protein
MAKARTQFTRLGAHVASDKAGAIRAWAAANPNDPRAQAELKKLNAAAEPENIRLQILEIVRLQLQDAAQSLDSMPTPEAMPLHEYAEALYVWTKGSGDQYEVDTPEGRMVQIVRNCAYILDGLVCGVPDFDLGVILGWELATKNHLLVREFADGPALAREAALEAARAHGGNARADKATQRDAEIRAAFAAASAKKPSLTRNGWADDHASQWDLSGERVRKILGRRATPSKPLK